MADFDLRELQRKSDQGDGEAREALYRANRRSGVLPTWDDLHSRFANLVRRAGGPSKGKSGIIRVSSDHPVDNEPGVYVELGTYDVGNWNSWTEIGPLHTFKSARIATADKLDEVEAEVERELVEIAFDRESEADQFVRDLGADQLWTKKYPTLPGQED
jgi:hypothetical protein